MSREWGHFKAVYAPGVSELWETADVDMDVLRLSVFPSFPYFKWAQNSTGFFLQGFNKKIKFLLKIKFLHFFYSLQNGPDEFSLISYFNMCAE